MNHSIKLFCAVAVSLLHFQSAKAQWTTSGTNTYFNSGSVSVGTTSFPSKFTVHQSTTLGSAAKNVTLLTRISGVTSNEFQNNTWLVRNAAGTDWYTSRLHDGISIDNIYVNPQTDTKTWWERDPYQDIQSWGTAASTYFTVKQGNFGIGTTSPTARLSVTSNGTSTLMGVASIADFLSNASDRARVVLANSYNGASKASSSSIGFAGYNLAGTGLEWKWEIGTDYFLNGGKNFYFWNSATATSPVFLDANGSVGISATTPISMFQVEDGFEKASLGPASGTGLLGTSYLGFNAARSGTNWTINADPSHNGGSVVYGDIFGNINFATVPDNGSTTQTISDAALKGMVAFQVTATGVARAKKVNIELTGWSDYVFDKAYKLPSLKYLKKYIDENHHLPDVPSANDMVSKGLDVAESNKILMKKIEELTLYLLEKDKQIEAQGKKIIAMQIEQRRINAKVNKLRSKK